MEKFDIKSPKYVSIILLICFIFIMVIWNAYSYLPPKAQYFPEAKQELQLPDDNEGAGVNNEAGVNEDTHSDEETVSKKESGEVSGTIKVDENQGFEEVKVPESAINTEIVVQSETETYPQVFERAEKYMIEKQYVKSLEEFQKASLLAEDNASKATCYEEIANIYGIVKRYGTALAFAQKAYNLAPTTARETLLARLYYKTGDIDKATKRINNVLQRDFIVEGLQK